MRVKFFKIFLVIMGLSFCLSSLGCSKEEEAVTYSAAMGIEIRTYWPSIERLYYGAYNSPSVDDKANVLTKEKNEL